ncbi:hypothetical protein FRB96_005761 [Tulasnella sp. 330]|nr:hypothetical protein FRB96_005761 [Tulasnella sp. 330]
MDFTAPFTSVTGLEKRMTAWVIPNAIQIVTTDSEYLSASFLSRDTTYDVITDAWRLARPKLNASGGGKSTSELDSDSLALAGGKKAGHKATACAYSKNKGHYPDMTMDAIFPGTPEKIYNLMVTSGFIKDVMANN